MVYDTQSWATKRSHASKMIGSGMKILRWVSGRSPKTLDRIRSEIFRRLLGAAPVEEKMRAKRIRWFGHVSGS